MLNNSLMFVYIGNFLTKSLGIKDAERLKIQSWYFCQIIPGTIFRENCDKISMQKSVPEMLWKFMKIQPKSTKMVPRIGPKTILEGSRIQDQLPGAPGTTFLVSFGTICAI